MQTKRETYNEQEDDAGLENSSMHCPFCTEKYFGKNLAQHLNEKHEDKLSFECLSCHDTCSGNLKEFLFHNSVRHPTLPLFETLGKPVLNSEHRTRLNRESEKMLKGPAKKRQGISCVFCKIKVNFKTKSAFNTHMDDIHIEDQAAVLLEKSVDFRNTGNYVKNETVDHAANDPVKEESLSSSEGKVYF